MPSTLLITNDFGPRAGGIESFVIGLLERMPKSQVVVYTSMQGDTKSYDADWFNSFGVKVIRDRSKILLPTPRVVRTLQSLIRQEGIENIWFGAAAPLGVSARWLKKAGASNVVALTHGHEVWWARIWPFSWAISEIAKQSNHLTYLGEFTKAAMIKRVGDRNKLVRVAPGIDTEHFKPVSAAQLREELQLAHRPTIVTVGRLVHRKGQDRLLEALPRIIKEIPDVALVFVGEGPHRQQLDNLVKKLGLQNHVYFIGRIQFSELPKYICVGDVFAMPSRSRFFGLEVEGLGIVYLEASACGLPVIAGASGGAPDAVIAGETGLVVDGNNLEEIAQSCINLLKSRELRDQMGKNGRAWVIDNWRWEIWSNKFNKLLGF